MATIKDVHAAWLRNHQKQSGNVATYGGIFWSYGTVIGYQDEIGRRVARVGMKISVTTSKHANALLRLQSVIAADLQYERECAAVICDWYAERGIDPQEISSMYGELVYAPRTYVDPVTGEWRAVPRYGDGPPCRWLPWSIVKEYAREVLCG